MILLENVDIERVNKVRNGKLNDRGCGKTTERMMALLSYTQQYNDNKKYLFIGENTSHIQEIYRYFYYWLNSYGVICKFYTLNKLKHDVTFPAPPTPTGFFQKFIRFFKKPYKSPTVQFYFATAAQVNTRGRRYDKIIVDVSQKTYDINEEKIKIALLAEK